MSISSRMACANLLDAASSTFSSRCVFRLMLALDRQPGSSHSVCNQTETRVWGSTYRPIAVSSAVHAQLPEIWPQGSGNVPTRSWFIDRLKKAFPILSAPKPHFITRVFRWPLRLRRTMCESLTSVYLRPATPALALFIDGVTGRTM